jgi:hypothetical protein
MRNAETAEAKDTGRARRIAAKNVEIAFVDLADKYPPVLSLDQAAEIAGWAPSTLKRKVSEGKFKTCVSRGKPLRFFRNFYVAELFSK